jgi:hypothetical protein
VHLVMLACGHPMNYKSPEAGDVKALLDPKSYVGQLEVYVGGASPVSPTQANYYIGYSSPIRVSPNLLR